MATGINFTPEGVPELNRALETLDKLTTSVGKLAGTGKSLEELRRIIVGVGASGSALGQLQNSIRELSSVVQALPEQLRTAMSGMSAAGISAGKALGEGVEKGAKESLARAKSAVRQEINELQMQYEAAVAKGWSFKPTALTGMKTLGISLFPSDRELLAEVNAETARLQAALKAGDASSSMAAAAAEDMRKVSLARGKAQLAAFKEVTEAANAQIVAEAKSEQARLQTALKAMDESSAAQAADASSIRKVSLARGKAQLAAFKEVTEAANAQIVAEAKAAQARLDAQLQALYARGARQSLVATAQASGGYSSLSTGKEVTPAVADPVKVGASTEALKKQSSALQQFAQHANEAHSAARGLASGLGLLWLTWGSMVPLLAGAAISHATVQMVKMGAEVEHTMRLIGSLGDVGAEGVKELNKELLKISSGGVYGPLQVAEALKAMSMAGLDAKQQIAALGATLQFAQLGEMPTKQAAETLAAIAQAFGYSARDWSVVGDIISQTAASTTATISDMAAAFKSSSVVAQLYGVTLQDTAVSLGLLNQIGIRGTAGGTAMRQMFTELIGVTAKGKKAIEQLGIQVMTTDKQAMLPFRDIIINLTEALSGMNGLGQMRALQDLMNERGLKAAVAGIQGYIAEQKNLGLSSEATVLSLGKLAQEIEDAPGTMAVAAAAMATTSKNLMAGVKTALESSLVETFDALQPVLVRVALALRKTFQSEGFKDALATLADYVGRLTTFIVDHASALVMLMKLYVDYRVALVALVAVTKGLLVWQAVTAAWSAATGALSTLSVVVRAATIALTGFNAALTTAEILTGAILIAAAAWAAHWWFFSKESTKANDERVASLAATTAISLGEMEKEYNRLGLLIAKMWEGTDSQTAQAEIKSDLVVAEIAERYKILKLTQLQIALSGQEQLAKMKAAGQQGIAVTGVEAQVSGAVKALENLGMQEALEISRAHQIINGLKERAKEYEKLASAEARLRLEKPQGNGDYPGGPKPPRSTDVPGQNLDLLAVEKAYYAQNMAELQRANVQEKAILDAKHKALLISEGQYQAQSLAQTITNEDAKVAEIVRHSENSLQILEDAQKTLESQAGGTNLRESSKLEGEAYKNLGADIKKLIPEYQKLRKERELLANQVLSDLVKAQQEKDQRQALLAIELEGKIAAESKAYKDLSREMDVSLQKQRNKLDLESRLEGMSTVQRVGAEAQLAFEDQSAQAIAKRNDVLQDLMATQAALADLIESKVNAGFSLESAIVKELTGRYGEASSAVDTFTKALQATKDKALMGGGIAREIAEIAQARKEADAMAKDLSKSLADAVMKGTAGFKSLWTSLKDWLKQTFAKLVLQPMLQPIMQSIAGQVVGSSAGTIAGQTIGAAAGSSALGSAAFSGVGGVLGTGAGGMSAIAGFGTAASYGANALMAGNGLTALSGGMSMAMAGELAQGIGMIAGVAGPIVISAMALASLDKKATPHMGGSAIADAAGNVTNIRQGNQDDAVQKSMQDVAKSSAALLNTFSAKFGGTGGFSVRAVLESDSKDGSWALYHLLKDGVKQAGSFDATPQSVGGSGTLNSDPTKAAEQFATMTAQAMRTSMETLDLPGWAKKQLDALGTEFSTSDLANAATSIYATQDAILALQKTVKPMAGSLGQLANSSSDTLFNLAQLAGGFDQLTSTLGTYYTNYYSAAEQQGAALSNLTAQYKELNMGALPTTKEAFRGVIDSFVAGGGRAQEGGEKTYLTLMQLANGFAALDSNAQDLTKQTDLQIAMLRAQGKESAAVAIERQREIDALSKTNPELVDMQKNLYALTDAAALKTARDDLQIQIDRALGDEAGALAIERQRELLALQNTHPELISLQQQLYNLADAATAAAAATKLYNAASSVQDKFLTDSQKIDKGYHTVAQTLIKAGNTSSEDSLVTMLKGLTKQDIYDLAASFITMSNASVEAKTSVAEAAGSLADLKDAAAQLAYDTTKAGMEKTIAEMTKQYGDLQAAMDLINPPLKTISQQYTDNAAALKTLSDSLDVLLGTAKKTPQEILSDMLTSQKALKDARSSVKDAILSSRLAGMTPKDKAAALREQEAGLYSQLRTAADPAAVVSKLQSVILERVKAEAAIQVATASIVVTAAEQEASLAKVARDAQLDSLKSQLDGFKKLKDLAANMGQFIGELKFSDLSSQNYADQLTAAQSLYYTTLDKARNGDANAVANVQGNASAYLKEAQNYYGGATAPYNAIFEGVLSSLNQLGLDAQNVDPQIAALQVQIDKMSAINAALDALDATTVSTSKEEVLALQALDTAIAARQEADAAAVAEQTQIAKEQLAVLEEQQKTLKEQILQQGKIYTDLIASLNKLNDNFEKAQKNANMEAAKP